MMNRTGRNIIIIYKHLYRFLFWNTLLIFYIILLNNIEYPTTLLHKNYIINNVLKNSIKPNKIVYIINPTAGLANTLRGSSSIVFLSFLLKVKFILSNWISISYYFKFPIQLIGNKILKLSSIYRKVNNTLISLLLSNESIQISDIHGSYPIIIRKFRNYNSFLQLVKEYNIKSNIELNIKSIIYHEFFIPSNRIELYITQFYKYKIQNCVLGIHIRSGKFINFKENYFHMSNNTLNNFYLKAKTILTNKNCSYTYIISDNRQNIIYLRNKFLKECIELNIPGKIYHSKFTLYNDRISLESIKLVTEFLLLSECNIILGTKRSSFSKEASIYNKNELVLI